MNINLVKYEIKKNVGKNVKIIVSGNRNKVDEYIGKINKIYPNLFTVLINGENKSFSFADIITKDVQIVYI